VPPNDTHDIFVIRMAKWASRGHVVINGLRVHRIEVADGFSGDLEIYNSWINQIVLDANQKDKKPRVYLIATRVRHIEMNPNCCRSLHLKNSQVERISCPPPEQGNPFEGSMFLSGKVNLDAYSASSILDPLQEYRNLRHCLIERRSFYAAQSVRAAELRAGRRSEIWLVRLSSWFYDLVGGYGNAPHRAAALMLLLAGSNLVLIWINKSFTINVDCNDVNAGAWLEVLCGTTAMSDAVASFLLAFQFIDPLGPFRGDKIILARTFWVAVWLWCSNLISLGLLAITLIGVRRRLQD
jgi:hypothetical protein